MAPSQDLYGRIRLALRTHEVEPDEHNSLMDAWAKTDRTAAVTVDDLPPDAQDLLEEIEGRPLAVTPQRHLYERVTDLLGTHDVDPEDRTAIRAAAGGWNPDFTVGATWDDLPAEVQQLIVENESLPRQSWDDPVDAPDSLDDLS